MFTKANNNQLRIRNSIGSLLQNDEVIQGFGENKFTESVRFNKNPKNMLQTLIFG